MNRVFAQVLFTSRKISLTPVSHEVWAGIEKYSHAKRLFEEVTVIPWRKKKGGGKEKKGGINRG